MNVNRSFDFSSEGIKQFDFDLVNSSVEFITSDQDQILVELKGKVYKEDDQYKAEQTFDETFSVGVTNDALQISQGQKNVSAEIIIHLPKRNMNKLILKRLMGRLNPEI